ncbi:unnamed protein product [Caenorhabditis brenneri]
MSAQQRIIERFEETYKIFPTKYKSLKNVSYIYKRSLFNIMYRLFVRAVADFKSPLANDILVFYLKKMESRLENHSEMIEYPEELMVETIMSMLEIDRNVYKDQVGKNAIIESCQMMLKECGLEVTDSELAAITKPSFEAFPIKKNRKMYKEIITVLAYVFCHIEVFHMDFFLPKDPEDTFKPVIRLFSNKNTHLVMANEVLENLREQGIDVSSLEEEVSKMSSYATWNFRELAGKIDTKDIEFVKIPLDLSDTDCSIPTSNGEFIKACTIFGNSEETTPVDNETRVSALDEQPSEKKVTSPAAESSKLCVETTLDNLSSEESSSEDVTSSKTDDPASESSIDSTTPDTEPLIIQKKQKKKNLVAVEMENIEQKEIIEMLKKKLQEKEEELQKKNTVIEVLEAEKEVMQLENQKNKEEIKVLELKLQTVKPTTSTTTQTMEQPTMTIDLSENAKDGLYIFLNVRNTLKTENPIQKIQEITSQLSEKSHDKQTQITANCEVKLFERKANFHMKALESHIKWVLSQSDLPSNWDPCLPEFPGYSQKFQAVYKTILKPDPPKICETLLKVPLEELEDTECVICSDDMESYEGTLKCENCKRRYHDGCAKKWFKVKRTCPMCSKSMLDEGEFPQLS